MIVPPSQIAERFEHYVGPLYERLVSIVRQSHTLAVLRDTLLPKLLSGELVAVRKAEKFAEATL